MVKAADERAPDDASNSGFRSEPQASETPLSEASGTAGKDVGEHPDESTLDYADNPSSSAGLLPVSGTARSGVAEQSNRVCDTGSRCTSTETTTVIDPLHAADLVKASEERAIDHADNSGGQEGVTARQPAERRNRQDQKKRVSLIHKNLMKMPRQQQKPNCGRALHTVQRYHWARALLYQ